MKKSTIAILAAGACLLVLLTQIAFTVHQIEKALVLQLGKPITRPLEPGLHFKLPFIQNVVFFDSRLLDYDARPEEVLTKDKKNMVVDNYSKWRIADPLLFYQKVKSEPGAQARLDDIIYAELRVALGQYTLVEVVSEKRKEIMDQVTSKSRALLKPYGIEVLDVRIKRTDLPPENERAIFGRMRAERERQAKQYRSEGREAAARITAQADKDRAIILAEASRMAEIARGLGDAEAVKIYAEAINQSPDFYAFKRSLEAYEKGLKDNTRIILTPSSPFLKFFH
ncbi:MAG: protease modulator HflC [Desulfovibrionaceae bacterium]|nr:protease modulator HflC [Desulfovibrionaceae bacterium]